MSPASLGFHWKLFRRGIGQDLSWVLKAGTSAPSSTDKDKVEVVYSCAIGVVSKTNNRKLDLLKKWYQIQDELNPRLAIRG